MLAKRLGRPRSAMRKNTLARIPPSEATRATRRSSALPRTCAASASVADAPERPPVKK
jgi:hypothetical protein